ncbi:DUF2543 family protein [Pantoea agglomerans]|uniref:DUF2543 family protein n=1 Tax=Enterobacter agglomerans TaxID=549 RepID=UPI003C7E074D
METTVPENIYAMTDEYSAAAVKPVTDIEREAVARLIYQLVKLLMEDGFTMEQRRALAKQYGVSHERAHEVEDFLLSWGLDEDE